MIFRRKIYDKILQWKRENNGKSALLIEVKILSDKTTIEESLK